MTNYFASTQKWHLRLAVFSVSMIIAVAGCGGGAPLAPVTGVVKYKGEPVKGGTLLFAPLSENKNPGKPASGIIDANGSYSLRTENPGDGAIIGKHRVTFTPADAEMTDAQRTDPKYSPPPSPYFGLLPKVPEVEVKSGANTIDIELKSR